MLQPGMCSAWRSVSMTCAGSARRNHDRRRHRRIVRRQEIWPAHADKRALQQIAHQIVKPVFVRPAIGVRERHNLARRPQKCRRCAPRTVPCAPGESAEVFVERGDLRRDVGRAVIDHDDFVVGIIEAGQRIQARLQGAPAVVAGDDDGNLGQRGQRKIGGLGEVCSARPRTMPWAGARAWSGRTASPARRARPCAIRR